MGFARQIRMICCQGEERSLPEGRLHDACRRYGWKIGADHRKIWTRAGMMDLTTTGKAVIKEHVTEGWQ